MIRLFDTATWAEGPAYRWAEGWIAGLAFAPDGLTAAAGVGNDGRVVVWDVDL